VRVNVYAEEMTNRVEIVEKDGHTGLRFYLELPVNLTAAAHGLDTPVDANTHFARGPFLHRTGDDDSAAVTFWGKRTMIESLKKAITLLENHYAEQDRARIPRPRGTGCNMTSKTPPSEQRCKHPRRGWRSAFFGWVTCGKCGRLGFHGRNGLIWNRPRAT
jgi:hypothetical protein